MRTHTCIPYTHLPARHSDPVRPWVPAARAGPPPSDVQLTPEKKTQHAKRTTWSRQRQQVLHPVDVVGSVGQRRHQLPQRHPPLQPEVGAQQHTRELAARGRAGEVQRSAREEARGRGWWCVGVAVTAACCRCTAAAAARRQQVGAQRGVGGGQRSKVWCFQSVAAAWVDACIRAGDGRGTRLRERRCSSRWWVLHLLRCCVCCGSRPRRCVCCISKCAACGASTTGVLLLHGCSLCVACLHLEACQSCLRFNECSLQLLLKLQSGGGQGRWQLAARQGRNSGPRAGVHRQRRRGAAGS